MPPDVVASVQRLGALKTPYRQLPATLAHPSAVMTRAREPRTDPDFQATEAIGSGPFRFVKDQWVPGSKVVYRKNTDDAPRAGRARSMAGGKIAGGERADDWLGMIRLNHLQPPFDKVAMRQAMYRLVNQEDMLRAAFGDPSSYRICHGPIPCGSPAAHDGGRATLAGYDPKDAAADLAASAWFDTSCDGATPGWPCDARLEALRDAGDRGAAPEDRDRLADARRRDGRLHPDRTVGYSRRDTIGSHRRPRARNPEFRRHRAMGDHAAVLARQTPTRRITAIISAARSAPIAARETFDRHRVSACREDPRQVRDRHARPEGRRTTRTARPTP